MKKIFSFAVALLFAAAMMAADWTAIDFLGDGAGGGSYTNKYKMSAPTASGIVNIQQPGFATEAGIYATFPEAITECSLTGSAIQGAGIVIYLSNFTAQETAFTVTCGSTVHNCEVYYADGTAAEVVPEGPAINPYAYAVSAANNGDGTITLNYSLNTNANSVEAVFYANGAEAAAVTLAEHYIGAHTATVALPTADGLYSVAVRVNGTSVEAPTKEAKYYSFWSPYSIVIDKDPASANFGRILVTEAQGNVPASGYHTSAEKSGVYAFNPDFTAVMNGEAPVCYKGGLTFTNKMGGASTGTSAYSPIRLAISEDGRIFAGIQDSSFNASVYELSADLQTWTPVISGIKKGDGTLMNADSAFVGGMVVSLDVKGAGENLKLLVYSCNMNGTAYAQSGYRLDEYALGTATAFTGTPTHIDLLDGAYAVVSAHAAVYYDRVNDGAYWFAANRGGNAGQPNLVHWNAAGVRDYYSESADFYGGAGLGQYDGKLYMGGNSGFIQTFIPTYGDSTVTLTAAGTNITTGIGRNVNAIEFDYAGNMYACSNSGEKFVVFAMPYSGAVETPVAGEFRVGEAPVATSYTITFVGYDNTSSDSGTTHTQNSAKADIFLTGADYVASLDTINKVYPARTTSDGVACGVKFGTTSAAGIFNITLIHPFDSVVVSAAMYGASEGGDGFTINGQTCALSAGNKVFETFTYIPTGEENTIQIQQIKAAKGRFYLNGITVYGDTTLPQPEPVLQMIANPLGADGRFIVKYDCEAGTWAEANPEVGETFTFAVDVTGSWLEEWLAAPATVAGAQRGLAINKWTSRGDLNGNAVRFKQISGNIWGMTANFAQEAQGWAADALANDSVTTVYGQLFGFEYTDAQPGAAWWQWDGHDVATTQAVGTDGLFAFAPSTGKQDEAFMTADMEGAMYGYNEAGYAEPCAAKLPFDHDLYAPATAAITNTYFATGDSWTTGEASTAVLDAETGDITVHIDAVKANQWQAQVFFTPGFEWEEGAVYDMEFKLRTNNQLGGVTIKINNDGEGWFYSYPNDNVFLADQNTHYTIDTINAGAKGAGNGEIIFAFGWVPAGTDIVISDIRISKIQDAPAEEATLVWTKQATYTNVPESWNTAEYTYPAIYTSDNIQAGMKVTVEKWSDNRLVIRNWFNTTDADFDGYTDVEITYTPGTYATVTALGGNAQSVYEDGTPSQYFYTGWPNDIYYAYMYTDGSTTYIDDNEDTGYIYIGYYIYNNTDDSYNYVSYYLTFEATTGVVNVDASVARKIFENGHVYILRDGKKYTVAGAVVE